MSMFFLINALIAMKASESLAVCQRGLQYLRNRVGKAPGGWRFSDVEPGCQGSSAPRTLLQKEPSYLGYQDSGNCPCQVLNPGIRHLVLLCFSPPLKLVLFQFWMRKCHLIIILIIYNSDILLHVLSLKAWVLLSAAGDIATPVTDLCFVCFGKNHTNVEFERLYKYISSPEVGVMADHYLAGIIKPMCQYLSIQLQPPLLYNSHL